MYAIVWTALAVSYIFFLLAYFYSLYRAWLRHKVNKQFWTDWKKAVTDSAPQGRAAPHVSGNGEK